MERYFFHVTVVLAQLKLFVGIAFVFGGDVTAWSLAQFAGFGAFKGYDDSVGLLCHKGLSPRPNMGLGSSDYNKIAGLFCSESLPNPSKAELA